MRTPNIKALKKQIEELQAVVEAEQERADLLGGDNMAVVRYHDISCRDNYCEWDFEGGDAAFGTPDSEHNRLKAEYFDLKTKAEKRVGVSISHEDFLELLLDLSGSYYEND